MKTSLALGTTWLLIASFMWAIPHSDAAPISFRFEGEVTQLKGPNQILNKLWGHVMDVLSLMGNPVWKNPTGSGVYSESIANKPGLIIDYNDGFAPYREPGMEVQSSVFAAMSRTPWKVVGSP